VTSRDGRDGRMTVILTSLDPSHTSDASHAMVRQIEGDQTDDQVMAKFYFQSGPATSGVEL
jgi:hypothetical protein